jgi:hypothetical protein
MPKSLELSRLIRHTEWARALIRNAGGCQVTDGEIINHSVDPIGTFKYHDPNGDEVDVTIKVRERR